MYPQYWMALFQCLIFSTLFTLESVPDFNSASKKYGASWRRSTTISQKRHSPRMSVNSKTYLYTVNDKLSFKGTGDLYQYIASLTTVHRPLKYDRVFKASPSIFSNHTNPIHLAALGLLRKYNQECAWLPQY